MLRELSANLENVQELLIRLGRVLEALANLAHLRVRDREKRFTVLRMPQMLGARSHSSWRTPALEASWQLLLQLLAEMDSGHGPCE